MNTQLSGNQLTENSELSSSQKIKNIECENHHNRFGQLLKLRRYFHCFKRENISQNFKASLLGFCDLNLNIKTITQVYLFAERTIIIQTCLLFLYLILSPVAGSLNIGLTGIFPIRLDNWHPPTFNLQFQDLSSEGKLIYKPCMVITTGLWACYYSIKFLCILKC